jgi:hypothetical protein
MVPTPELLSQAWIFCPSIPPFQQESDTHSTLKMDLKIDLKVVALGGFL